MNLEKKIKQLDILTNELNELRPIEKNQLEKLEQKLRLDWNYHSNSMEGNTLSENETRAFLLHGITAKGKPFRDYLEMKGHNEALKFLQEVINKGEKITETLIKDIHKKILVEPYTDADAEINPGEYKKNNNYLYSVTGERIDFLDKDEVPQAINDLVNWFNNQIAPPKRKKKKYNLHPVLIASAFMVRFIEIHPFGDGNGRVSRIVGNLILMQCGYTPAIIRLEERDRYYNALNLSSLENPEELAEYVAEECIKTTELAIKVAKGKHIYEDKDIDNQLKIIEKKYRSLNLDNDKIDEEALFLRKFDVKATQNIRKLLFPIVGEYANQQAKFEKFFEEIQFEFAVSPVKEEIKELQGEAFRNELLRPENMKNLDEMLIKIDFIDLKAIKDCSFQMQCNFTTHLFDFELEMMYENETIVKMKSDYEKIIDFNTIEAYIRESFSRLAKSIDQKINEHF